MVKKLIILYLLFTQPLDHAQTKIEKNIAISTQQKKISMTEKPKKKPPKDYVLVEIDPERIQLLGMTQEKVIQRTFKKVIRTVGTVEVDERLITHIQTKFKGWIEDLHIDFVGMPVNKGEPLFSMYSPELVATQEEYLTALKEVRKPLQGMFAEEFLQASKDLALATRQRLQLWDISDDQIRRLEQEGHIQKTLVFHSPLTGIVLSKKAFLGMNVAPGMTMYSIADLSNVWVLADIYEPDMSLIKIGIPAEITFPSYPDKKIYSKATFVDYVVQPVTRTAKVRFDLPNPDYWLKPGMYSTVTFSIDLGTHLALPDQAVIKTGPRTIVFVPMGEGRFDPREVELGFKGKDGYYQILSGLKEGEAVVTSAQFLLDSESRMKAMPSTMKGHGQS